MQHRLRERGSGMLVRFGYPEDIIVNLVKALQARGDEIVAFEIQKEVSLSVLPWYILHPAYLAGFFDLA